MLDRTRLSRLITMALASCVVTWALAGAALARPDNPPQKAAPTFKAVAGDIDKAPSATRPPAFKGIVADANKAPDPVVVDRNIASLKQGSPAVATGNGNTDTIALITAIAAMLVALAAVTLIMVRPQRAVLRT